MNNNTTMSDQDRIKMLEEQVAKHTESITVLVKIVTELRDSAASDPIKPTTKKVRTQCKCGSTEHKNISHKDCPMNKKNNPFAEASDEPKPAPKKRGRPKKADKEVVSTSEENPIDDMLSKLTLNETDSQETVLNEDAFPSPVSEPEAKKQTRDEKMMDLFGDSEETLNELLEVKTEDDTEKAKELEKAEKAARKAEEKAAKAKAKELEKAEKAAKKAEEKAAKAKAKELEKAEKAAKKAEEKAEKAKAKELEKAEKTEQDKKVSDQLDEIGKLLAKPVVKMEIDADKEFQEIQGDDDELDDLEAALSDLELEPEEQEQEEQEEEEQEEEELIEDDLSDDEDVDLTQTRIESLD